MAIFSLQGIFTYNVSVEISIEEISLTYERFNEAEDIYRLVIIPRKRLCIQQKEEVPLYKIRKI